MIKKLPISEVLDRLWQIHRSSEVNIKKFNSVMRWFENHAFYLDSEMCQTVNRLRREIEDRFSKDVTRVLYDDIKPNNDMNELYFLEEQYSLILLHNGQLFSSSTPFTPSSLPVGTALTFGGYDSTRLRMPDASAPGQCGTAAHAS